MSDREQAIASLPAIAALRDDLLAAFAAHEPHAASDAPRSAAGAGRSLRMPRLRHPIASVAAVVAILGATGAAVAATTAGGGSPVSPEEWVAGKRAVVERSIAPEQSAHLAILRRPRTAADAMPAQWVRSLSASMVVGGKGANPSLARRARGFHQGAAWVVPAAGSVCVVAASTDNDLAREFGYEVACSLNEGILAGELMSYGGGARKPNTISVLGVVPDGVNTVTATSADGATRSIAVHENVYMATILGSARLSFEGPNGRVGLGQLRTTAEMDRTLSHLHVSRSGRCVPGAHVCRR